MSTKLNLKEFQEVAKKLKKGFSKDNIPEANSIYVSTNNGTTSLITTDFEIQITVNLEGNNTEQFKTVIPGDTLKLVNKIKNESEIEVFDNVITTEKKEIEFDQKIEANKFPVLDIKEENMIFECNEQEFKELIKIKQYCSKDDRKIAFQGVLFTPDSKIYATDSHRLAIRELKNSLESEINVPQKALDQLDEFLDKKGDETVKCYQKGNKIKLVKGNVKVLADLLEEEWPNLDQVIPRRFTNNIHIDKKELLSELEYLKGNTENNIISMYMDGFEMVFEGKNPDTKKKVASRIEAYPEEGEFNNGQMAFNVSYLLNSVKLLNDDEVKLQLAGQYSPFMINSQDLILPVRKH